MVAKFGSIRDFFKPYAAPKEIVPSHDGTNELSRQSKRQTTDSESNVVKHDIPSSAISPISPPRRRNSALKDLPQSQTNRDSADMSFVPNMLEDPMSEEETLHILVKSPKVLANATAIKQMRSISADDEVTEPSHQSSGPTPDETAPITASKPIASTTQLNESLSPGSALNVIKDHNSHQAETTIASQTPAKTNASEILGNDDSTSPLSPMPSHLSTPLVVRSIQRSQTQALNDLPAIKAPVFTTETLPTNSQKIVNSSFSSNASRRTVIDGVNAVTNSDSDADNLSSSDDGLPDLSDMVPRKKQKITPEKMDTVDNFRQSTRMRPKPRPKIYRPTVKVYKNSLADMAKQIDQETANAERRKLAEEHVQSINTAAPVATDLDTVAINLASDQEDKDRLKAAMSRMEVMSNADIFYFFGQEDDQVAPRWPEIDNSSRWSFLNSDGARSQAFLTGFVSEMLEFESLPEDNLRFICQSLLHEQGDFLCRRYLQVLEQAIQKSPSASVKDLCSLGALYPGCTNLKKKSTNQARLPQSIKHALSLLAVLSKSMSCVEQLADTTFELILLNIDQHVSESIDLRLHIGRTLGAVISSEHMQQAASATINKFLQQESLTRLQCCRAINSLPAMTAAVHRFRRQLAVHYVLDVDADELVELSSAETATRMIVKLKHDSRFSGDDDTDWDVFLEMMKVLDIVFDVGFSDFDFLDISSSVNLAAKQSPSEAAFNTQIDAFIKQLRLISNKIKDSGTSHLKRTEAKHALNAVVMRLESCVRTRSVKKAGVFGGWDESNTLHSFWSGAQEAVC